MASRLAITGRVEQRHRLLPARLLGPEPLAALFAAAAGPLATPATVGRGIGASSARATTSPS